jgi:hypothetical protein
VLGVSAAWCENGGRSDYLVEQRRPRDQCAIRVIKPLIEPRSSRPFSCGALRTQDMIDRVAVPNEADTIAAKHVANGPQPDGDGRDNHECNSDEPDDLPFRWVCSCMSRHPAKRSTRVRVPATETWPNESTPLHRCECPQPRRRFLCRGVATQRADPPTRRVRSELRERPLHATQRLRVAEPGHIRDELASRPSAWKRRSFS